MKILLSKPIENILDIRFLMDIGARGVVLNFGTYVGLCNSHVSHFKLLLLCSLEAIMLKDVVPNKKEVINIEQNTIVMLLN